jgi:hypothetical protein
MAEVALAARTVTVAGGNLFQVAAAQLGDATQAHRIAILNGLTDFFLSGTVTLAIPRVDLSQTGGVPAQ